MSCCLWCVGVLALSRYVGRDRMPPCDRSLPERGSVRALHSPEECAGSRGGTPLRDPGVRASLLTPHLTDTPGVLRTRQMNHTPLPSRKPATPMREQPARDCIPADRTHLDTPANKAAAVAAPRPQVPAGSGFVQPHGQCAPSLLCAATRPVRPLLAWCLAAARPVRPLLA